MAFNAFVQSWQLCSGSIHGKIYCRFTCFTSFLASQAILAG